MRYFPAIFSVLLISCKSSASTVDKEAAYTYGRYNWTFRDASGKEEKYSGVFHTVWRKMSGGSWKYVWD